MALLRLSADILFYLALGLLVYWYSTEDVTALLIVTASGVISFVLFVITIDIKQSQRKRHQNSSAYEVWDWFYIINLIELPFRLIGWLLSSLWRIFD